MTVETLRDCRARMAVLVDATEHDPGEAARELFALAVWIRGRAWRDRRAAMGLVDEIDARIAALCRRHGLLAPPSWSLADVIAGGPGWATRRPT
jgi:hypothetical protein